MPRHVVILKTCTSVKKSSKQTDLRCTSILSCSRALSTLSGFTPAPVIGAYPSCYLVITPSQRNGRLLELHPRVHIFAPHVGARVEGAVLEHLAQLRRADGALLLVAAVHEVPLRRVHLHPS